MSSFFDLLCPSSTAASLSTSSSQMDQEAKSRKHALPEANEPASKRQRMLAPNGWVQRFEDLSKRLLEEDTISEKASIIRSRLDVCCDTGWESVECLGDSRMRKIRWYLEKGFKIERWEEQIMFHDAFLEACLPKIYGDEWSTNSVRVMKEFGIKKIQSEVMVITARRIGKTWSVAMLVLAILLVVHGIEIAIFSTGSRASGALYATILKMLSVLPDEFGRIVQSGKEKLLIASHTLPKGFTMNSMTAMRLRSSKDTSILHAFPDAVKGEVIF
jgi:hypothetical protein